MVTRQPFRIVVPALLLGLASITAAQDSPRAVVAEPVFDAGIVARGDVVRHSFQIQNEGPVPLDIHEVRPACGCTVAEYDETIAPGESGKVTAEVSTQEFRGPVAKYVTVLSNDRENPRMRLTIRADIRPIIDILPGYARYLHVQGTDPKSQTQTVWATDGVPLTLESATANVPFIEVEYRLASSEERRPEGPDRQWIVVGTLASDAPEGAVTGAIQITTNHPDYPEINVPIGGYVRPQVLVTPKRIDFGTFPAGQPRRASVLVTNFGTDELSITGVESDVPGLTTELEEQAEGRKYAVKILLESGAAAGPLAGRLTIRTDNPDHPTELVELAGAIE